MHRSLPCLVRSRGLLSSLLPKSSTTTSQDATESSKLTKQQQDSLRSMLPNLRTDSPRHVANDDSTFESDDLLDSRIDMDAIRARGLMKYKYNYGPPANVEAVVTDISDKILKEHGESETGLTFKFEGKNDLKAKVILAVAAHLNHCPTNARLLHLKTVSDLVEFYAEPYRNINEYTQLARSQKPKNVSVMEEAVRFHPEDKDSYHGGVTAFPGTGGGVYGLRNKRILRQFKPKEEWFDYEDQTFDYTRPDKDMPWDPEIAKKMDRYPDKRYNLTTKQFTRVK